MGGDEGCFEGGGELSMNPCDAREYESNLAVLKEAHHQECLFNQDRSFVPGLNFYFDDAGVLHGRLTCGSEQQGYLRMVHGGIIAAVSDASMAQCLMGHGIVGYTADLSVKYRKPIEIDIPIDLRTRIIETKVGMLFTMRCEFFQKHQVAATAEGRFYRQKEVYHAKRRCNGTNGDGIIVR